MKKISILILILLLSLCIQVAHYKSVSNYANKMFKELFREIRSPLSILEFKVDPGRSVTYWYKFSFIGNDIELLKNSIVTGISDADIKSIINDDDIFDSFLFSNSNKPEWWIKNISKDMDIFDVHIGALRRQYWFCFSKKESIGFLYYRY